MKMEKNKRSRLIRRGILGFGWMLVLGLWHIAAAADQPPSSTPPAFDLAYEQNLLSAKITKQPLLEVLAALEKQMPLRVHYRDDYANTLREITISATFEKLPIHEGMQRLLEGRNYALRYGDAEGESAAKGQSLHLWLLSGKGKMNTLKGEPRKRKPVPPMASYFDADEARVRAMSIPDLIKTALTHRDDTMRMHATDELINRENYTQNPQIVDALWKVVRKDPDADIRQIAVEGVAAIDGLPFSALADVYHTDKDEHVRARALRFLAQNYGEAARELITQAAQEPDYYVRRMAAALEREMGEETPEYKPKTEPKPKKIKSSQSPHTAPSSP
jgi:hypothetical protein